MKPNQDIEEVKTQALLTRAQVATRLQVHLSTVDRWIGLGILKAHRIGKKCLRIAEDDLQRMLRHEMKNKFPED